MSLCMGIFSLFRKLGIFFGCASSQLRHVWDLLHLQDLVITTPRRRTSLDQVVKLTLQWSGSLSHWDD